MYVTIVTQCCISVASVLHQCCISVASVLHRCCISVASVLHQCCINSGTEQSRFVLCIYAYVHMHNICVHFDSCSYACIHTYVHNMYFYMYAMQIYLEICPSSFVRVHNKGIRSKFRCKSTRVSEYTYTYTHTYYVCIAITPVCMYVYTYACMYIIRGSGRSSAVKVHV